ncbi:haloacid dehalogenase-like hydrolase [Leptospira fluminis]|uniref:Haloacid dehalogenase-like hydrolase n=1 Tax=Leptospira fluminis TaxID=2484979 RepID=A0A4R9GSW5_9LEPT|nr:haloacid dehalogenase-like hydrolase [Leptospira fluminis]
MLDRLWTPELDSFLKDLLDRRGPIRAVFDFDNTLVRNDFGEAVMNRLLAEGVPWIEDIRPFFSDSETGTRLNDLRKKDGHAFQKETWKFYETVHDAEGLEASYRWSTWIFSGRSDSELRRTAREVWEENRKSLSSEAVRPYTALIELIRELRKNGADLWIVTASPQGVIQEVSSIWGIPEDRVLGVELEEESGILKRGVKEPFTYGSGKVRRILDATGGEGYEIAFGDTENDFPLLENSKLKGIFLDRGKGKNPPLGSLVQPVQGWPVISSSFS